MQNKHDDDTVNQMPFHLAVGSAIAGAVLTLFLLVFAAVAWLLITIVAFYFALTTAESFSQSVYVEIAVTLLLFGMAPLLLEYWRITSWRTLFISLLIAVVIVGLSSMFSGALQAVLLGVGGGLFFLAALDFYVQRGVIAGLEGRQQERLDAVKTSLKVL